MAKLGRRPNVVPSVEWKAHIPVDLAGQVELLLLDPVTSKPRHGARSELVTRLLRDWILNQQKGN